MAVETSELIPEEKTIDASTANKQAFYLMLPLASIVFIPYVFLWKDNLSIASLRSFAADVKSLNGYGILMAVVIMITGILAHELIHGLTWSFFVKERWRSIKFGVLWKEMIPYCHCTVPMDVKHYRIGTVMPLIVLGLLPAIAAYLSGNIWILLFATFFTAAAAGDVMILRMLKNEKNVLVKDHPEKIGCIIFRGLAS